jgi:hypothetical protein
MTSIFKFSEDISNLFGKIAVQKIASTLFACHSSLVKLLSNAIFNYKTFLKCAFFNFYTQTALYSLG